MEEIQVIFHKSMNLLVSNIIIIIIIIIIITTLYFVGTASNKTLNL